MNVVKCTVIIFWLETHKSVLWVVMRITYIGSSV
jgi:hypothetical protein